MNILTLLKMGGSVEFPWGYKLTGSPSDHYIYTYTSVGDGTWYSDGTRILDNDGCRLAVNDAKCFKKEVEK